MYRKNFGLYSRTISHPKKTVMKPKFKDNRYSRAVKVAMNKLFNSKSVLHKDISEIIAAYSHKTLLTNGSYLLNRRLQFFVIREVLSAHFCRGFYCPSKIDVLSSGYYYMPNLWYRSPPRIKKIFDPFGNSPFVKNRTQRFFLKGIQKRHGTLQAFHSILEQMH